eukprot:1051403-Pelagomonas_calceolata.AAC.1
MVHAIRVFYEFKIVKLIDQVLTGFPAKIEVRGAIFWAPAPAPQTPQNVLLIKCPAIAAGQ